MHASDNPKNQASRAHLGGTLASAGFGLLLLGCVGTTSNANKGAEDAGGGSGGESSGRLNGSGVGDASPGGTGGSGASNGASTGSATGATSNGDASGASTGATQSGGGTTGPMDPPIMPHVNDCSGLGAEGVFEEITPPEVKAGAATAQDGGGTFAIAVDPVNLGTIYVGTLYQKLWKSTDCGATWTNLSASGMGAVIGTGMNWTLAVDPQDPQVVYTNSGYSKGTSGLYKSTSGGADWTMVWPPASQPDLARAFTYNFANVIALDPTNHLHVLLTFHEACLAPHPATCIAESMDGGATWKLLDGEPSWSGNEGQVIFFLDNSSTWLWGSQSNGFWRTENSGNSWEQIQGMTTSHLQGSELARTKSGDFYQAAADGIWHSPDGKASTWKLVANTGPIVGGLVDTGTNLIASTCYFPDFCKSPRYLVSGDQDGQTWTELKGPAVSQGGTLGYDPGHKLLYSSNLKGGLWRVVMK